MIGVDGEEIGDECVFTTAPPQSPPPVYGDPSIFRIGRHVYAVQLEYSNAHHGCAGAPLEDYRDNACAKAHSCGRPRIRVRSLDANLGSDRMGGLFWLLAVSL